MRAILMNFGDNTRVVHDVMNMPISVGIGKIRECDMHKVHYDMIRKGLATDTLMLVPADAEMPAHLSLIMGVLEAVDTEPYDELLQRAVEVIGKENVKLRPNRDMIRVALRDLARELVSQIFAGVQPPPPRVPIKEEGDEDTRNDPPRKPEKNLPGSNAPLADRSDAALLAAIGEKPIDPVPATKPAIEREVLKTKRVKAKRETITPPKGRARERL